MIGVTSHAALVEDQHADRSGGATQPDDVIGQLTDVMGGDTTIRVVEQPHRVNTQHSTGSGKLTGPDHTQLASRTV